MKLIIEGHHDRDQLSNVSIRSDYPSEKVSLFLLTLLFPYLQNKQNPETFLSRELGAQLAAHGMHVSLHSAVNNQINFSFALFQDSFFPEGTLSGAPASLYETVEMLRPGSDVSKRISMHPDDKPWTDIFLSRSLLSAAKILATAGIMDSRDSIHKIKQDWENGLLLVHFFKILSLLGGTASDYNKRALSFFDTLQNTNTEFSIIESPQDGYLAGFHQNNFEKWIRPDSERKISGTIKLLVPYGKYLSKGEPVLQIFSEATPHTDKTLLEISQTPVAVNITTLDSN